MSTPQQQSKTDFGAFLNRYIESDPDLSRKVADAELHLAIAEDIYRLRTERDMTQQQLAAAIGSSQSVIARLEDAEYEGHSLNVLQRIATALNLRLGVGFYAKADPQEIVFTRQDVVGCVSWSDVVPTTFEE